MFWSNQGLLVLKMLTNYVQAAKQEHKNLNSYLIRHGILTDREIIERPVQRIKFTRPGFKRKRNSPNGH